VVTTNNTFYLDVTPCGFCKNDIPEVPVASIIKVTRMCELRKRQQ
jgi:hypothetical protein